MRTLAAPGGAYSQESSAESKPRLSADSTAILFFGALESHRDGLASTPWTLGR